jgi:hypothetical protein
LKFHLTAYLLSFVIMQPLDVILAQSHRQIVALLEFVRYDYLPQIQQCSIKIMGILRYIQIIYVFFLSADCHFAIKCLLLIPHVKFL